MINMGLYKVEFYAPGWKTPCGALPDAYEDYNDAMIAAEEHVRRTTTGRPLRYEIRMLSEDEDAMLNGYVQHLIQTAAAVPDIDTDKTDFIQADHLAHAVYFLVMMYPNITKRGLRKRLGVGVDDALKTLLDLDVIRAVQADKWHYRVA